MSELDLGLKVGARRLLWRMGFSTRVDVPLRAFQDDGRRAAEAFTDLDVLGVTIAGGFLPASAIADCKTSRTRVTERVFWLKGLAEFFDAGQALMVREHDVPRSSRQLATRLGVTIMTSDDLNRLESLHMTGLNGGADPLAAEPIAWLFDRERVAAYLAAFTTLDARLKPLLDYRQFDYWVYEEHRNPVQMVAHLADAARRLDPRNPLHLALFVDCAWLYVLSLTHAIVHIRTGYLRDPDEALQAYIFGGALAFAEKRRTAEALAKIAPEGADLGDPLPAYYPALRELVVRLLRRPEKILTTLRYAELLSMTLACRDTTTLRRATGAEYDEVAAKQLADVTGFLVAGGDLDGLFNIRVRQLCLDEVVSQLPAPKPARSGRRTAAKKQTGRTAQEVLDVEEVARPPTDPDDSTTSRG